MPERDIAAEMRAAAEQPPAEGRTLACELLGWADQMELLQEQLVAAAKVTEGAAGLERARLRRALEPVIDGLVNWSVRLRNPEPHLSTALMKVVHRIEEVLGDG